MPVASDNFRYIGVCVDMGDLMLNKGFTRW